MVTFFGHSVRSEVLFLCLSEVVLCFAAFLLVFLVGVSPVSETITWQVISAALLAASVGVVAGATGLYSPGSWLRTSRLLTGALIGGLALLLVLELAVHAGNDVADAQRTWRWELAIFSGFLFVVMVTRLLLVATARAGHLRRRVVLVRDDDVGPGREHWVNADPLLEVVTLNPGRDGAGVMAPSRLRRLGVWAVVFERPGLLSPGAVKELEGTGVKVYSERDFIENRLGRVELSHLAPDWKLPRSPQSDLFGTAVRRSFDVIVSAALLLLTLPLLLVTALAIKLDSPGPIFYRQERVGRNGRVFSLLKFRSMRTDAEAAGAPQWASRQDSRVTRVGRFIRLTRIDEVPQVLNVLRGDMAFVGPRPERPAFVRQLSEVIPHFDVRLSVKPGITGWAQVNYPYGASIEDARMKLSYDLYYVMRRSLFLDLLILLATVRVVLFQEGSR